MSRRAKQNPVWKWDPKGRASGEANWWTIRSALPWVRRSDYRHLDGHSHLGHLEVDDGLPRGNGTRYASGGVQPYWWVDIFNDSRNSTVQANYQLIPMTGQRRATAKYPYTNEGFEQMIAEVEMGILSPTEYLARSAEDSLRKNPKMKKNPKLTVGKMTASSAFDWSLIGEADGSPLASHRGVLAGKVPATSYRQFSFETLPVPETTEQRTPYFQLEFMVYAKETHICLYVPEKKKYWQMLMPVTAHSTGPLTAAKLEKIMTWVDIQVAERLGITPVEMIARRFM